MNIKRTTSEQQVHTNKNEKNYKNEKNKNIIVATTQKRVLRQTQLLHSRGGVIQTDLSESGNQKPNLQSWADDIRKMIEIDKRTENQVRGMIEWSQHNVFWASNILSAKNCEKNTTQWQRKQIVIIKQN